MHQGKMDLAEVVGVAKAQATPNQIAMLLLFFTLSGGAYFYPNK